MTRGPESAYRATIPAAVRASLDRWQEERTAFFERVEEFGTKIGHEVEVVGNGTGMWAAHLAGDWYEDGKYEGFWNDRTKVADIPAGWHYYVRDKEVRPYAGGRDANSKQAVADLAELNKTSPGDLRAWITREFGVDLHGYGFEPVGDTFYVLKGNSWITRAWDGNEHFAEVPMSTYWLDKENATSENDSEVA